MPTSASESIALRVDSLTAGYGPVTVVRNLSLEVRTGEFVAILGPNGVGKTTLVRAIVGDAKRMSGSIHVGDQCVDRLRSHQIVRHGVAVVPEGRALVPDLSVRDNLVLGTRVYNSRYASRAIDDELDAVYERFPVLGRRRKQLAGSLSGGEQQMLAIGRAFMSHPTVLILDEPSLGLAPILVRQVFDDLAAANLDGVTILVAEQNAAAVLRVAGRSYVMKSGQIVADGTSAEITASEDLIGTFIGHDNQGEPS